MCRSLQATRTEHNRAEHPYQPFPIDLLEETVNGVPASAFSEHERPLLDFGCSRLFR